MASLDLVCKQGSTFERVFTWRIDNALVNLAGFTARMQVRRRASAPTVLLSLTSGGGGIAFPSAGLINVQATAAQTAALPAGYWRYDLELVDGVGRVYGIAEGCFEVAAEVTR